MRWIAIGAAIALFACDGSSARDEGVRRREEPRESERPTPIEPPPQPIARPERPFDFRLAEWMPEVYVDSMRDCRMVGFEAERRRSIAECTSSACERGVLAWDHTTRIELRTTEREEAELASTPPSPECPRDARVRIIESPRRTVRAVLVHLSSARECDPEPAEACDPDVEVTSEPASSDLRRAEPGSFVACYVGAVHGVEREGDELLADVSCAHEGQGTRFTIYAPLGDAERIARLAPARIAEVRIDSEFGDEGELISVLDAPWFDPRILAEP